MTTKKQRTKLDELISAKVVETIPKDNNEGVIYIRVNEKEKELFATISGCNNTLGVSMFQIATQDAFFFEVLIAAASAAQRWKEDQEQKQKKFATKVASDKNIN
jgi:hypothetical protein